MEQAEHIQRRDPDDRIRTLIHDLRQYLAAGLMLYDADDDLTVEDLRNRLRRFEDLFRRLSDHLDREARDLS